MTRGFNWRRRGWRPLAAIVAGAVAASAMLGVATAQNAPGTTATAEIKDTAGRTIGTADFRDVGTEVVVHLTFNPGALTGSHAIHIFEVGLCDPPDFMSAGNILNPFNRRHGLREPDNLGPMLGDMPNIVLSGGMTGYNATLSGAGLGTGQNSLLRPGGTAIVIHEGQDDQRTHPDGNSGARVACGLIVPGASAAAAAAPKPGVAPGAPVVAPAAPVVQPAQPAVPGKPTLAPTPTPAVKPGTTAPGTVPGAVQPALPVVQPGVPTPTPVAKPAVTQPGVTQPGAVPPPVVQPVIPGKPTLAPTPTPAIKPGTTAPGVVPGAVQPGAAQPAVPVGQPGVPTPTPVAKPGLTQPGVTQPGAVPPPVVQPVIPGKPTLAPTPLPGTKPAVPANVQPAVPVGQPATGVFAPTPTPVGTTSASGPFSAPVIALLGVLLAAAGFALGRFYKPAQPATTTTTVVATPPTQSPDPPHA